MSELDGSIRPKQFLLLQINNTKKVSNFVYTTKTISTIVDKAEQTTNGGVYTTKTISTIVDQDAAIPFVLGSIRPKQFLLLQIHKGGYWELGGLYDQNNFYYCRCRIVDSAMHRLYDQNNFYYCRYIRVVIGSQEVYTTKTISTIVDTL